MSQFKSHVLVALVAALFIGTVVASSKAAVITYAPPTINGTTVTWPAVSENSITNPVPLYGAPSAAGDTLRFRNLTFGANSTNGVPGVDFVDGQLNFIVQAKPGQFIQSLQWSEFGDYFVFDVPGGPIANAFAKASSGGLLITVLEVNNNPVASPLITVPLTFNPFGGNFQAGLVPASGAWTGDAFANIAGLYGSNQITRISVSINNQLLASSDPGAVASISKKGVDIVINTIPEPSAAFIVVGAFAGALLRRRNRVA